MQKNSTFVEDLISTREGCYSSHKMGPWGEQLLGDTIRRRLTWLKSKKSSWTPQIRTLNGHVSFAGEIIVPMRVRKLAPRLLEFVLLEGKNRQIRTRL